MVTYLTGGRCKNRALSNIKWIWLNYHIHKWLRNGSTENMYSILEHPVAEKQVGTPPQAADHTSIHCSAMSFGARVLQQLGLAKQIFRHSYHWPHSLCNKKHQLWEQLGKYKLPCKSLAEFPIMVFMSPLPNSQFPNPTNGQSISHGLKIGQILQGAVWLWKFRFRFNPVFLYRGIMTFWGQFLVMWDYLVHWRRFRIIDPLVQ